MSNPLASDEQSFYIGHTYSVTWATMLKQEQRREIAGWKANSLTTAVSSKVK